MRIPAIIVLIPLIAATQAVSEQVPGGGFEGGIEALEGNWTFGEGVSVEHGDAAEGDRFLRCSCVESGKASWVESRSLPVEPNAGYLLRCRLQVADGGAHFTFGARSGGEYLASIDSYGGPRGEWDEIELPFRTGDATSISVICSRRYGSGSILFDDVRLERDDTVRVGDISPAPNPMPAPTAAETERGFIVSQRPWIEPVYPTWLPRRQDVVESLVVRLAPGEYEPLTICVTALKPLAYVNARVELIDARTGPGISVGHVRTMKRFLTNAAPLQPGQRFERRPMFVFPGPSGPVEEGETQRLWLTVRAAEDAAPGSYEGTLIVSTDTGEAALPLIIDLLPIDLPEADATFGMYYRQTHQYEDLRTNAFLQRSMRDMREHGCNSFSVYADVERKLADGAWEITPDNNDRKVGLLTQMRLLERFGLARTGHPLLLLATGTSDGRFHHGAELVRTIQERAEQEGWPELLWYLVDEPSPEREPFLREVAGVVHSVPGARSVTAIGDPTALGKYYDVWIVSNTVRDFDRVTEQAAAQGAEVWTYNCVWNGAQPRNDRYFTGLFTWAYGLRGNWQWCYCEQGGGRIGLDGQIEPVLPNYGDPWRVQYVAPGVEFNAPTVGWEGRREGIDDLRYLQALEAAIEAQRADRPELAREAEGFLDYVRRRAKRPDAALPASQIARVYDVIEHPGLTPGDYDAIRRRAAELIVALTAP